jgi:hypothetical protein
MNCSHAPPRSVHVRAHVRDRGQLGIRTGGPERILERRQVPQ